MNSSDPNKDNEYPVTEQERRLLDAIRELQARTITTAPPMLTVRVVRGGLLQITEHIPRGVIDTKE